VPLARALSKLGVTSRADAAALIRDGRVSVDGRVTRDPAAPVVPERARLAIDGAAARRAPRLVLALHKPRGVVTTTRDPEGRPTVLDLVADAPARVVPVGRLDLATSGLLLLTNDTRFADWVTDPAHAVPRTYAVTVRGEVSDASAEAMRRGVADRGERLQAGRVEVRKRSGRETHLLVVLTEGKNREVRRLVEAVGHEVTRLTRTSFGGLALGTLPPGAWRTVTSAELTAAFPGWTR
jgi:23S rRNA pseudouridine2605 synthase